MAFGAGNDCRVGETQRQITVLIHEGFNAGQVPFSAIEVVLSL